jgi:two-component system chemotaxis response regulator CheY
VTSGIDPFVKRPRIVVAEDSCYLRDLIALVLAHRGFDVVATCDGEEALASILSEGADGLVSDQSMPRLDGLALCRVLRALRAYTMLPIVVFTGVDRDDARLGLLNDMIPMQILAKPMGLHGIAPALHRMLATATLRPVLHADAAGQESSPRSAGM